VEKYDQLYMHHPHLFMKEIRRPLRKTFVVIIPRTLKMDYLKLVTMRIAAFWEMAHSCGEVQTFTRGLLILYNIKWRQ
jgi:hypothetical protein